MEDFTGKMVRITDIGKADSRFQYKDIMVGMIVKVLREYKFNKDEWFSVETTIYPSQQVKIYNRDYYSWPLDDIMTHHKIKVEEI